MNRLTNRLTKMSKAKLMLSIFHYISNQLKIKKELEIYLRNPIEENKLYLQEGKYYLVQSDSGKILGYKNTKENKEFVCKMIDREYKTDTLSNLAKTSFRKFLDNVTNFRGINITNNGSKFDGKLIMVTYNKDVKVFDLDTKEVLSVVKKRNAYNNLKQTLQLFNNSFKTLTLSYLDEDQAYIERYVDYKPYNLWSKFEKDRAVEVIFSNYKNYFLNDDLQIKKRTVNEILQNIESEITHREILEKLSSLIEFNLQDEWALVKCHGDVVFSNIILYEKEYYFIDWIDSDEYIFFYDLINFMFGEAAFHNNYYYVEKFLKGIYDREFSNVFKIFGHNYTANQRLYYLALFVIERINFRIKNKNDEHLYLVLNNYYKTLIKIENISKEMRLSLPHFEDVESV